MAIFVAITRIRAERHALHAARVTFPHPGGAAITAEAPRPSDLARLIG